MKKITETNLEIDDWFDYMAKNNSMVDLWVTDPPYPFNNKNGTGRFLFEDGDDKFYDRITWSKLGSVFEKMFEISNGGARAYIFANKDGLFETKARMEDSGWIFRNIIIWDKLRMGMGYHWRHRVEYILYFSKEKPLTYVKNKSNIFSYKKPKGGISEKPFELWSEIMESSSFDNDICADPFSGTNPMKKAILNNLNLKSKIGIAYTNTY